MWNLPKKIGRSYVYLCFFSWLISIPKQHSTDSGPLNRLRRFHLLQLHLKYLNWHHGAVFASLGFWGTLDDRDIWERQFVGFMDIYTDGDRLVFIWVYVLLWRWCWVTPTHVQACSWSKQRNASGFWSNKLHQHTWFQMFMMFFISWIFWMWGWNIFVLLWKPPVVTLPHLPA